MKTVPRYLFILKMCAVATAGLACRGGERAEVETPAAAETAAVASEETAAEAATEETRPACPDCGTNENVVPIVYGKPGRELVEAAERGEVVIKGCVRPGEAPEWHCKSCGREWK